MNPCPTARADWNVATIARCLEAAKVKSRKHTGKGEGRLGVS